MVTGASGFLGKALVNKLLQIDKAEVMAVCRFDEKCKTFSVDRHLITKTGDLAYPDELQSLISEWKPEFVFHLGALARLNAGQQDPEKAVIVNLLGSIRLLELSARFGVKKFLFTSSDLSREARSVVGITKLLMEYYLQLFALPKPEVVTFRMPNLYDFPGSVMDIFARQIAEDKDLTITDERMARRFLTREEAVDYLLFLKENGMNHKVYSVKQEPIRIKDLALKMISASGKDLKLNIIGARPGEKIRQISYSDSEAKTMNFKNLAKLKLLPPVLEDVSSVIRQLPVSSSLKEILQDKFNHLSETNNVLLRNQ